MSADPKPKSNSVLKNLPEERQAAIMEMLVGRSYDEAVKELRKDGINTNKTSLGEFFSWRALQDGFRENAIRADAFMAEIARQQPDIAPGQLKVFGDLFFTKLAIAQQDNEGWTNLRRTALKEEQIAADRKRLELEIDKFQFDATKAALAQLDALRKIKADNSLNETDRIQAAMKVVFGERPAS